MSSCPFKNTQNNCCDYICIFKDDKENTCLIKKALEVYIQTNSIDNKKGSSKKTTIPVLERIMEVNPLREI